MRITCIQMDMAFAKSVENFQEAEKLVRQAVQAEKPDVILLPELWNTGFFPREDLPAVCDPEGAQTKRLFSALARELQVNIVAGSVAVLRAGKPYNTAFVFDRKGTCVAQYDKTHLFSPMGEDIFFQPGNSLCTFRMDGVSCGLIICYDLRFPELTRSLALQGIEVLFLCAQWPAQRTQHLHILTKARAVENQMFLACCNSCGADDKGTRFGGCSILLDPWGGVLAQAAEGPCRISADFDLSAVTGIRESINVFRDRRPEVYAL